MRIKKGCVSVLTQPHILFICFRNLLLAFLFAPLWYQ
ncbi:hypothetical protein BACOVA_04851 [Bacteroides ovatus ATCC 8483]|uniref:Uncharacterized protein n=1 Tax=Bacteroides ovatus (strain ATCC 8483 / DSM 1896 / JCM 5824 / BCRC 10623 / CCUG 4943 / NCTC 11153) TaxID=411476 RepID=A0AAN3A372_BACO1|nr:hypothetical protein BACOVA_04851 [Bacteroides ovatus ATCC 8483]